ncbi:MAG: Holliday junction branch migration protein RuvA [Lentisphaeria bacterium]|nr:Holliday junction branch migration protein RuvA [Lentisphaeria bacterium]
MIERLNGILVECELTEVVLDVHGVGYALTIPMSTYDRLPRTGTAVQLLTYLHVREDLLQLYGFSTAEERSLFKKLIAVSGVGPRIALNILSCMTVGNFCRTIIEEDVKVLTRVNGLGKKSAERLIIELRNSISDIAPAAAFGGGVSVKESPAMLDAVAALETLGFKAEKARTTVQAIAADMPDADRSAENLIRKALQKLNG